MFSALLTKHGFSGAADAASWASLAAYALQTVTKISTSYVSVNSKESLLEDLGRKQILEMLKFLFFVYMSTSIIQYIVIRWNVRSRGFPAFLKAFEFASLALNAFLTRIFLKELGINKGFSPGLYFRRSFASFLRPLLKGNSFYNALSTPMENLFAISNQYLSYLITLSFSTWNSIKSFALIFKPLLLLAHYGILLLFFLSFSFVEPIVLFSNALAFVGNFAAHSDIMSSKVSMLIGLVLSAAVTLVSLVILYNCTILGASYVLPAEIGLCVWLLVFFCCALGLFKIFVQRPEEGGYLWTLPQFAGLLAYQTSTVLAICQVASVSGHVSLFELWHAGTKIDIFTGFCVALRLICQALLVGSIIFSHLVAYCPDFVETLTAWFYPPSIEDDISEEATSTFFLMNLLKGLWIFSKPIFIGLLYVYVSKSPSQRVSAISNLLAYPSWLTLISLFINLVASSLVCMYFLCVYDPVSVYEEQEVENFLKMIKDYE